MRPQPGLTEFIGSDRFRTCAERPVGAKHARGEAIEQHGLIGGHAEVSQVALHVRRGQRKHAAGRARLVVLVCQRFCRFAIVCDAGGKGQSEAGARQQPDSLTQAHDGIEDDTSRP